MLHPRAREKLCPEGLLVIRRYAFAFRGDVGDGRVQGFLVAQLEVVKPYCGFLCGPAAIEEKLLRGDDLPFAVPEGQGNFNGRKRLGGHGKVVEGDSAIEEVDSEGQRQCLVFLVPGGEAEDVVLVQLFRGDVDREARRRGAGASLEEDLRR